MHEEKELCRILRSSSPFYEYKVKDYDVAQCLYDKSELNIGEMSCCRIHMARQKLPNRPRIRFS